MPDYDPAKLERFPAWAIHYDDFATIAEAAECLGVHPVTLAKWRKKGQGPQPVGFGRCGIGYRWPELLRFAPAKNVAAMLGRLTGRGVGFVKSRKLPLIPLD